MAKNFKTTPLERLDFETLIKLALSVKFPNEDLTRAKGRRVLLEGETGIYNKTLKNQLSSSGLSLTLINYVRGILDAFFLANKEHFQKALFTRWKQHIDFRIQKEYYEVDEIPHNKRYNSEINEIKMEYYISGSACMNASSIKSTIKAYRFTSWTIYGGRELDTRNYHYLKFEISFFEDFENDKLRCKIFIVNNGTYLNGFAILTEMGLDLYFKKKGKNYITIQINLGTCIEVLAKNIIIDAIIIIHSSFKLLEDLKMIYAIAHKNLGSNFETMIREISFIEQNSITTDPFSLTKGLLYNIELTSNISFGEKSSKLLH